MTIIEIKSRYDQKVIFSAEATSIKMCLEIAVKKSADLRGADLRDAYLRDAYLIGAYLIGADLRGAYLIGADLRDAYLIGADLRDAYLIGADLRGADLIGADLRDAYLRGAYLRDADLGDVKTPPINDHYFTSEILFRFAKTENQKNFAARVRMELNLCWNDFYKLAKKMKVTKWAEKTLSKWDEYKVKIAELKK